MALLRCSELRGAKVICNTVFFISKLAELSKNKRGAQWIGINTDWKKDVRRYDRIFVQSGAFGILKNRFKISFLLIH